MVPQVKSISTSEGNHLEAYTPEDKQKFCVIVRVIVGLAGGQGAESFDITVCTPQWLGEQVEREGFVLGLHHVFVKTYDPAQIKKLITKWIERCSGKTWQEVAQKISRIGYWEFESYTERP